MKLAGKTAFITGAGGGIGRAISQRLAAEGAIIAVTDINLETAESVATEIRAAGGKASGYKVDVTDSTEVNAVVSRVEKELGPIDILVNNAGGAARGKSKPFHEETEEIWDWVVDTNLKGTFICSRAVINGMIERKSGKIVNMASIAAIATGGYSNVNYASSKGGIISMTRALAKGAGPYGINVNCISPGAIETPGVMPTPEAREWFSQTTCLGRNGRPEEVAELTLFLVSHESAFITGQNFIIDGGRSLGI